MKLLVAWLHFQYKMLRFVVFALSFAAALVYQDYSNGCVPSTVYRMPPFWPISSNSFPVIGTNATSLIRFFRVPYLYSESLAFLFHDDSLSSHRRKVALAICCLAGVQDKLTISVMTVSMLLISLIAWPFLVNSHSRLDVDDLSKRSPMELLKKLHMSAVYSPGLSLVK